MRKTRLFAGTAGVLALAMTAACGGGGASGSSGTYNAGLTSVVNPTSGGTGTGTLKMVAANDWDSPDPGNTWYSFSWDFGQFYERPLVAYARKPGNAGLQLVPDLATGLGRPSDGGKTWTYHIASGLKLSNGQPITSQDVAYAVYRSNWGHTVLPNGPTYFLDYMDPNVVAGKSTPTYPGPYKGSKTVPSALISTPDPTTIVFHLQKPFADFDYLATLPQTSPVPPQADTGATYQSHIVSAGPYVVDKFTPGTGMTLSKNPTWMASEDPNGLHPQNYSKIVVQTKVAADTVDQDVMSGQAETDMWGNGVQSAAQTKILSNPKLHGNSDDPYNGFLYYAALNTKVKPFTNLACRQAVEYAADKAELKTQYSGSVGGSIAHTLLPPTLTGYTDYPDLYPTPGGQGDPTKAEQLITQCKSQMGSSFTNSFVITARDDKPKEVSAAQALMKELKAVGFSPRYQSYPSSTYFSDFAGVPTYANSHDFGIQMMQWGADWPDGFGFLEGITDGTAITSAGNSNLSQLDDPAINAMFKSAIQNMNTAQRDADWGKIDEAIMKQAAIVPIVYGKALLYRPPNLANVYVSNAYGMYMYASLAPKK